MMNEKKALKIFEACVNEMYMNSVPPTSWADILLHKPKDFFVKHVISEEKYLEIKSKYVKKLDLFYGRKLDWFLLDYSPCFKKEDVV